MDASTEQVSEKGSKKEHPVLEVLVEEHLKDRGGYIQGTSCDLNGNDYLTKVYFRCFCNFKILVFVVPQCQVEVCQSY